MEEKFVVETTNGKIQGYFNRGVIKFKGIPYAAPPIGNLRFKPPVPVEPWEGVLDTTKYGPVAPQPPSALENMFSDPLPSSEADCLTLNIWTQGLDSKNRPVMFWIHGGAFITGSGRALDGSRLVLRGNVVVVSINYRLGALGFLYMRDFPDVSPNVGLLDMVTALKFVKDNISRFGGDPNNITIFGESAGGSAVACLLAMPSAKGLFQRAILQSQATNKYSHNPTRGTRYYEILMERLGLKKGDIDSLCKMPYEKIIEVQERFERIQLEIPRAGPVMDKDTLPTPPHEAVINGYTKDIDIFIGTNLDETKLWSIWAPEGEEMTTEDLTKSIDNLLKLTGQDKSQSRDLIETYKKRHKNPSDISDAIFTDFMFHIPSIRLAEAQSKYQKNIYMYLFTWQSSLDGGKYGAMHALELPFVFGLLGDRDIGIFPGRTEETQRLSEQMMDTWIAFARSGNPNNKSIPKIPPYDLEKRTTIIFDKEVTIQNDPFRNERIAWEGIL
ncbi:MAG: carboxylesterase/lipase family protein [Promethearchaeota archaeon]